MNKLLKETIKDSSPQCYIHVLSFVEICPLIPEKKIFIGVLPYRVSNKRGPFIKLLSFLDKMLKPFDFLCGLSRLISLSSDDVSPPDGASTGSDVIMSS